MSSDLSDEQMITTLLGKDVEVTINGEGVFINDAKVIVVDLEADNGVVHIIDAVLLPPAETALRNIKGDAVKMSVYPNPSNDLIRLSGIAGENNGNLKVVSASGAVVMNRYIDNSSSSIDIRSLGSGSYFILFETKSSSYIGKLPVK
jgi:hypothetical protein